MLIGYTVDDINISAGPDTIMAVRVRPWGDTIHTVNVTVDYGSLPSMGVQMAAGDLHVIFAGQVATKGHISICSDTVFAGRSGITRDITKPGIYGGFPARPHMDRKKI